MTFEIDIPEKYAQKLAEVEAVEPTIRDQIEVEVLPHVLRLINETHSQLDQSETTRLGPDSDE